MSGLWSGPIDEETHFLILSLPCRPHCSAHLHVRSMSRRAHARQSADTPGSPVSTYSKDTWPWEIVKVLRDAQRAGNSAGMTEADILLVIANTLTSRGDIKETKRKVQLSATRVAWSTRDNTLTVGAR